MMLYDCYKKNPNKVALVMQEDDGSSYSYTFQEIEDRSNQLANYLIKHGIKRGDTVALLMENRPNFVISWY